MASQFKSTWSTSRAVGSKAFWSKAFWSNARRVHLTTAIVLATGIVAFANPSLSAPNRTPVNQLDWTPVKNGRLGFMFAYPAKVYKPEAGDPTAPLKAKTEKRAGQVFRSTDGKAFLQVAAFANVDRIDIAAYKARVAQTYNNKIEYERLTPGFFVLSGVRGKDTFYERVYFTCGGRVITAWSMTYPTSEGALYDRIVEEVARTFRPAETPQACAPG
jgi:hypothetical protein